MGDPTYTTKLYLKQGGDELVVKPGGKITADGTQAAVLTTAAISALTTVGAASLSTDQTLALTTSQLTALCTNNDLAALAIPSLQSDMNAIKVALTNVGVLAPS